MLIARTWGRSRTVGTARRLGLAAVTLSMLLATFPASAAAAPRAGYTLDLGRRADFVAQTNNVQCVGASTQMMLNIDPARRRSDCRDPVTAPDGRPGPERPASRRSCPQGRRRHGLGYGLTLAGAGPYRVVGLPTIDEALLVAARAIASTGRPVGLLMWHGRHAWVMSGFTATADPFAPGARITGAIVEDPLYPHGSAVWGPSPAPGATLSVRTLARQFVPRASSWGTASLAGMYVLVLPYEYDARILRLA